MGEADLASPIGRHVLLSTPKAAVCNLRHLSVLITFQKAGGLGLSRFQGKLVALSVNVSTRIVREALSDALTFLRCV